MYKNMVHLATNNLSKDIFDEATFNKVNIWTNQNETFMERPEHSEQGDVIRDRAVD
jgi:hypothetical protein